MRGTVNSRMGDAVVHGRARRVCQATQGGGVARKPLRDPREEPERPGGAGARDSSTGRVRCGWSITSRWPVAFHLGQRRRARSSEARARSRGRSPARAERTIPLPAKAGQPLFRPGSPRRRYFSEQTFGAASAIRPGRFHGDDPSMMGVEGLHEAGHEAQNAVEGATGRVRLRAQRCVR